LLASSYPPSTKDACWTSPAADRVANIATGFGGIRVVGAVCGFALARGRRGRFAILLILVPVLLFALVKATLFPGANCRPFD
jgi:hypothetical protein